MMMYAGHTLNTFSFDLRLCPRLERKNMREKSSFIIEERGTSLITSRGARNS